MMLWFKAWRESRARFLVAAGVLTAICLDTVFFEHVLNTHAGALPAGLRAQELNQRVYNLIYGGSAKGLFAFMAIFLGLGGLLRERAHKTDVFTLALPASRARIVAVQFSVGILEIAGLSLLPALLLPAFAAMVHQYYPLTEALHFSVLWFAGGMLILACTLFLSTILAGEYTALMAGIIVLSVQALVGSWGPLARYRVNIMWTIGERNTMHWNPEHSLLLPESLPWPRLMVFAGLAALMLLMAIRITEKQDY